MVSIVRVRPRAAGRNSLGTYTSIAPIPVVMGEQLTVVPPTHLGTLNDFNRCIMLPGTWYTLCHHGYFWARTSHYSIPGNYFVLADRLCETSFFWSTLVGFPETRIGILLQDTANSLLLSLRIYTSTTNRVDRFTYPSRDTQKGHRAWPDWSFCLPE